MSKDDILSMRKLLKSVVVSDNVYNYIVGLVSRTRPVNKDNIVASKYLLWGAGPRACQNIVSAAKCHAVMNGKFSPDKEDVDAVCKDVLRHRIVLNYSAQSEMLNADDIIEMIIKE